MRSVITLALAAVVSSSGFVACSGAHAVSSTIPVTTQAAKKHVRHLRSQRTVKDFLGGLDTSLSLLDAPLIGVSSANAQFNVGILGVDLIDQNGDSWQLTGGSTPQVVNLLALQTTANAFNLGAGNVPAGTYPSAQLLLDPATTSLTYNGQTYPVNFVTPDHPWWDPTQTVEVVTVPLVISGTDGQSVSATLDFNLFQSADLSNGVVSLTPTVAAGFGQPTINGTVVNAAGAPVSNATIVATDSNGNVANVTASGADGTFQLHGINAGGYTLSVVNSFVTNAGDTVTASGADPGAAPSQYVTVGPNSQVQLGSLQD